MAEYPVVYTIEDDEDAQVLALVICVEPGSYERYELGSGQRYSGDEFDDPMVGRGFLQPGHQSPLKSRVIEGASEDQVAEVLARLFPPVDPADVTDFIPISQLPRVELDYGELTEVLDEDDD